MSSYKWKKNSKHLKSPLIKVAEELVEIEKEIEKLFEESVIEPELEEAAPKIDLSSLKKKELLALAKEKGLEDVSWRNTKNEIIAAIQKAD